VATEDREAFYKLLRLAMTLTQGFEILYIHPWDMQFVYKYGSDCFEPCVDRQVLLQYNFAGFLHEPHRVGSTALYFHYRVKRGTAVTLRVTQGNASQPETLSPLPMLLEPPANMTVHVLYPYDDDDAPLPQPSQLPRTAWDRLNTDDD
jgi:hypothetical protein